MRLEPMLNLTAAELLSISLAYYNKACPPTLLHDMSHLSAGMLVNPRAYEIASSLSDPTLVLKRFCRGPMQTQKVRNCWST